MKQYYSQHSVYSDPGKYRHFLSEFPDSFYDLRISVNQLFLHYADEYLLPKNFLKERYAEMNLRYLDLIIEKLILLKNDCLIAPRKSNECIMGICRDSALLFCAILRERGISARLRSGYVTYFIPGLFLDGLITEYFNVERNRWCRVDTRTSQTQINHYHLQIDFDLSDLPDNKFVSAAAAWKLCRSGKNNPARFGSRQYRGLQVMRNRLIQDLALLNKEETLVWDLWGRMLDPLSDEDLLLMDQLADLLIHNQNDLDRLQNVYHAHPDLARVNPVLVDSPFIPSYFCDLRGSDGCIGTL